MDDSLVVRRRETVSDLKGIVERLARGEGAARELGAERLAFQELLDDIGSAVMLSDVVDARDVGMVERTRRLRLLLEAAEAVGVAREGDRQHFDRDVAL